MAETGQNMLKLKKREKREVNNYIYGIIHFFASYKV